MRSSARPVLLRSLKVIGGATAPSAKAVVATRFCSCADDEILIASVLPSGIWYQFTSFILRTSVCFFAIVNGPVSRKLSPATRESPLWRLFLVEIVFTLHLL